jgi:hypothetical protein
MQSTDGGTVKAQYAKSTDPEVIAVVTDNASGLQRAVEVACVWAESKGSPEGRFYGNSFLGVFSVHALPLPEKPKGWANGYRGHGYRPRANSPEEAEMKALGWSKARVPGLPDHFEGAMNDQAQTKWFSPTPFLSGDAAWVLLSEMPVKGEFGEQWTEVKASEAYAAKEAHADASENES